MAILSMYRGDTKKLDFTITDPGQVGSPAVNLTGKTLKFTLKRSVGDTDVNAITQKTIGSGIVVTNAAAGQCRVTLSPADTAGLTDTRKVILQWDLQLTDGAEVTTVAAGQLTLTPDVTRT